MLRLDADVAIIGSGFAGSLLAIILRRQGLDVVMLDRARHPRFAIGESSTPVADLVLGDLCDRYDLPRIKPLTRYGTWRRTYPGIVCGLKRGFSYFHHRPGEPFRQDAEHTTELLVTASGSDDVGDTHWYRADVDAFLAGEACAAGVRLLEEAHLERLEDDGAWALHGTQHGAAFCVRAGFVIDGSGAGGVLPQRLALPDESDSLRTQSRTVYAHVRGLRRWSHVMQDAGQCTADHPYPCDDAALHHIFPGAWMWVLPFDNGITSVGFVFDERKRPLPPDTTPAEEWRSFLAQFPSVQEQFARAELTAPFETFAGSRRLQRLYATAAGRNWALLPNTAGFIDALYSTGIAHSLCGVERLAAAFEDRRDPARFEELLGRYSRTVTAEVRLIDRVVAASFDTFGRAPELFAAVSTLYFAAATTCEQRWGRSSTAGRSAFLLADDASWLEAVTRVEQSLHACRDAEGRDAIRAFERDVADAIAPFNLVGLCDSSARNMYRYTAAPK